MVSSLLGILLVLAAKPEGKATVYKTAGDRPLTLYVTQPETDATSLRPAIVFFHGGGWVGGKPGQFTEHAKYLAGRGMVAIQVEYRLLDRKSNDPPLVCVHDAKSAMKWVRSHSKELGIDPERIASAGGSAGGHLAAFVGMVEGSEDPTDPPEWKDVSAKSNAMVLFNPVFDNGPKGWGTKRVGDRYKEFSPFHNISSDDPPALVFLGSKDALVPVSTLDAFQKKMQEANVRCETRVFEGMPHGFFNYGRYKNKPYQTTIEDMDRFLVSLGWLSANTDS